MGANRGTPTPAGAGAEAASERAFFGRYLQAVRLERNIRLERVAEETRIALATLQAIENEDFGRLPPDVFLRGFLRAYAGAIGANPDEAVRRYDARRMLLRFDAAGDGDRQPVPEPQRGRLIVSLVLLAGLVAVSLLGYHYFSRQAHDGSRPPSTQSAGPAAAGQPSSANSLPPSEAVKKPRIPSTPKHVLIISAQEAGWVKVSIDQGTPLEHTLKAGGEVKLEAQASFNLLIGNAAGIRLNLDGKPVQVPGKRGEVVNLHLP
jgi:transcriptional regulator with XRE-family HTH domain